MPFSHPDWLFEIKWDGFRSFAYLEDGRRRLISRNGNEFKSFAALNLALPLECGAQNAVLDGEVVCLDKAGNSQFKDLLFRQGEPRYYAFDLLFCNGEDLRYLPLADRKHRLRGLIPGSALRNSRLQGIRTRHAQMRQGSRPAVPDDAAVVQNLLELGGSSCFPLPGCQRCAATVQ